MAKEIRAKVIGGSEQVMHDVETVGQVARRLNCENGYTASVNGEPAEMYQELNDYEFVSFAKATKGGC